MFGLQSQQNSAKTELPTTSDGVMDGASGSVSDKWTGYPEDRANKALEEKYLVHKKQERRAIE